MSVQEEQPNSEKATPIPSQHKWIATIIWLGLLASAVITSIQAIGAVTAGGLLSIFFQAFSNRSTLPAGSSVASQLVFVSVVGAALALVAIGFLASAWLKLVNMSRALIVSFAWLERDSSDVTMFFDWLNFSGATVKEAESETVGEIDLDEADGSLVGDVIRYLAYALVALLAISPVTSLIGAIFK